MSFDYANSYCHILPSILVKWTALIKVWLFERTETHFSDSFFYTSGVTIEEFQDKLRNQPWWNTQGLEADKIRMMAKDSIWLRNFMSWSNKEDEILGKVERTLKWRQKVDIYSWSAGGAWAQKAFENPFLQLHGRDADGQRVLWKVVKFSNTKHLEEGKQAISYYFELLHRAEPDAKLTIVFNLQGSGLAQSSLDYLKHFMFLCTEAYPNLIKQLVILDLPWVLKSIWAIVKLWLDEKQKS